MKSLKTAVLLSTTLLASAAHADFIGANAEAGTFDTDKGSATYISADVQHPIPVIPNIRVDLWDLETDEKAEISHFDITGYYGIGLLWASVEAGFTYRQLDMTLGSVSESESAPMLYLGVNLAIPGTGATISAESKTTDFDDVEITDQLIKVQYQPLPIVGIEVGFRSIDQTTNVFKNLDYDGYFIGLTVDI
ncbi:hypothetical protein OFY17_12695 [Marinomonas sp. C2222]|uniref:Outer membrane protein beta-barrel domain-containing protein n=1 Tax=Marinomonas sargassi TaxID=2984494 RepID=A0ABT2YV15_9GAMM|nr:hypothetical protein [Marinomonas sargassi]MCV2403726.1 hypothetical protein [Marinomonas sargassi]